MCEVKSVLLFIIKHRGCPNEKIFKLKNSFFLIFVKCVNESIDFSSIFARLRVRLNSLVASS